MCDCIRRGAMIVGEYRYRLWRVWSEAPCLGVIMLNPSTADAEQDDPTIRRLCRFARRDGFGGIQVLNLFAYRATDPAVLKEAVDPVGERNDSHIESVCRSLEMVVCAWGAHPAARERAFQVQRLLLPLRAAWGTQFRCFGLTQGGHPKHPLYVPSSAPLQEFAIPGPAAST
jgi:hypothetical protein